MTQTEQTQTPRGMSSARASAVVAAAIGVEAIGLVVGIPLLVMAALSGWCSETATEAACSAQQRQAENGMFIVGALVAAAVGVALYAVIRRVAGASLRSRPRRYALGLTVAFEAILPAAVLFCTVVMGDGMSRPDLAFVTLVVSGVLFGCWAIGLRRVAEQPPRAA